jgi:PAS domain S-box-containing protein
MTDSRRGVRTPTSNPPAGVIGGFDEGSFAAVFDTSGEALLVINARGVIQRVNRRARELLGMPDAVSRQNELADFLPQPGNGRFAFLPETYAPGMPHGVDAALRSGLPVRVTLRSILPGSRHLLLCVEERGFDKTAETERHPLNAALRSALDSMQAGIALFDLSGQVRYLSPQFGELFGLDAPQLEKINTFDELSEKAAGRFQSPEIFSARWKAFRAGNRELAKEEVEVLHPRGRVLERISRPVLDSNGQSTGWLEIYTDVTDYRQIQSKMLQTEKMAALGEIVSGIAHELNNPLTSIMGYAQLLLGHGLAGPQLAEARNVYQEADRARRIVKNLLYFARENKPERSAVDLNEIVERTLALRGYELKVENIRVQCDLAPGLPKTMADPYQLQQVVLNLLVNAEHALTEKGREGHLQVRTHHLKNEMGSRISLEVSDDGPGISPEIAPRIFAPFFTTKAPGVGTGLGLSIVYGIVRQHEGDVTFESQPGSGARFLVELPVIPAPAEQRSLGTHSRGESRKPAPGRILVVEDEATVAQLIVDILQEEGHRAEAVLDSEEGLARISRDPYDLVICDFRMSNIDGRAFYQALAQAGSPMQNKLVFVTGDTVAPGTLEFLEANHLPYLAKPFRVEELTSVVNRQLDAAHESVSKSREMQAGSMHS